MIINCNKDYENFNLPLGWLSPTGEFIECSRCNHVAVSEEIIKKYHCGDSTKPADDRLIGLGWVHISLSILSKKGYQIYWDTAKHLSSEQFSFLQNYFVDIDKVEWFTQVRWDKECDTR